MTDRRKKVVTYFFLLISQISIHMTNFHGWPNLIVAFNRVFTHFANDLSLLLSFRPYIQTEEENIMTNFQIY